MPLAQLSSGGPMWLAGDIRNAVRASDRFPERVPERAS